MENSSSPGEGDRLLGADTKPDGGSVVLCEPLSTAPGDGVAERLRRETGGLVRLMAVLVEPALVVPADLLGGRVDVVGLPAAAHGDVRRFA